MYYIFEHAHVSKIAVGRYFCLFFFGNDEGNITDMCEYAECAAFTKGV